MDRPHHPTCQRFTVRLPWGREILNNQEDKYTAALLRLAGDMALSATDSATRKRFDLAADWLKDWAPKATEETETVLRYHDENIGSGVILFSFGRHLAEQKLEGDDYQVYLSGRTLFVSRDKVDVGGGVLLGGQPGVSGRLRTGFAVGTITGTFEIGDNEHVQVWGRYVR